MLRDLPQIDKWGVSIDINLRTMRQCLLRPTQAHADAADLLSSAADALLLNDLAEAKEALVMADLQAINEHVLQLVSKMTPEVHRLTTRPAPLPKADRHPKRMPPPSVEWRIYERDGWRCRFCEMRVISRRARQALIRAFPEETRWTFPEFERHYALYALASSLDHVVPHSRGGINDENNFVTACYGCQFGRGEWLIEEVEVEDPRSRSPLVDEWDGLVRLESYSQS